MRHVLLQLLHSLQGSIFGLRILQKGSHVKHIIQVGLDLNLQLIALRMLKFLENMPTKRDIVMIGARQLGSEKVKVFISSIHFFWMEKTLTAFLWLLSRGCCNFNKCSGLRWILRAAVFSLGIFPAALCLNSRLSSHPDTAWWSRTVDEPWSSCPPPSAQLCWWTAYRPPGK